MSAFDTLPAAVRARLRESAFDFPPSQIAADVRRFRLSEAETLSFIDALERWAGSLLAPGDCPAGSRPPGAAGNRLEAECPVGRLVAEARASLSLTRGSGSLSDGEAGAS